MEAKTDDFAYGDIVSSHTSESRVIRKEITKRYEASTAIKNAVLDTQQYVEGGYKVSSQGYVGWWYHITYVKEIREEGESVDAR